VRRASEGERERLHETFTSLCRIESPSGRERACADWVTAELRALGLEVEEDDAGPRAGSDAGNLLVRIPGGDSQSVLLCGHLDTVPPTAPIEPVVVNGGFENANDGILGADNKAMVAAMVELARRLTAAGDQPPVGVELLFTVSEEVGLLGAQEFDVSRLKSSFGFLFDNASPTYYRVVAELHGRAAHAGIRPEEGRSAIAAAARGIAAMRLGRLDPETTCNVGTISGGTNVNVIPERCRLVGEARSLDTDRAEAVATEMVDHLQDAANEYECDLDVTVERVFKGYRTRTRAREVLVAERALRACGYEPRQIVTGGASDANALQAAGFACATLADGTVHNHEPGERISIDVLDGLLDVALALVEQAGRGEEDAPS
jgi:tripeptide aminopeptidase